MNAETNDETVRLRFLLDTNAFIALEPYAGGIEPGMNAAATLVRLAAKQNHRIFVHPASRDELAEGRDRTRSGQRIAELAKFEMLSEVPIASQLRELAGDSFPGTNDHRDLRLLAALHANAVNYLVTDDVRLRKRARRADLEERILNLADAAALLVDLEPSIMVAPPRVHFKKAYELDLDQAIFDSLRSDYERFDEWINRVRLDSDNRLCFVIVENDGTYSAIALLKRYEANCPHQLLQPVSKISTFKVSEDHVGNRYGELLLKSILLSHRANRVSSTYVEVFPKHSGLIEFLRQFGFCHLDPQTERGENILAKRYNYSSSDAQLDPLDFHVRFGPPAVSPHARVFVIPIEPRWHRQLFPETLESPQVGEQLILDEVMTTTYPWGNALRKAYLCNTSSNLLHSGDVVLFYQSHGPRSVTVVGVVEKTMRSMHADEALSAVGGRTVYSPEDVRRLCNHPNGVLVILFRQDRILDPDWTLDELMVHGVLKSWPQTVTRVREAGAAWVLSQLSELR